MIQIVLLIAGVIDFYTSFEKGVGYLVTSITCTFVALVLVPLYRNIKEDQNNGKW